MLIAHSNDFFGSSLWTKLVPEPDLEIVGMACTADEAVNMVSRLLPDLALVDLTYLEQTGLETIQTLRALYPHLPIIAFVPVKSADYFQLARKVGATICLTKADSVDTFWQIVHNLAALKSVLGTFVAGGLTPGTHNAYLC
jgi:DNA-binding NarL/FixJ family response regulator